MSRTYPDPESMDLPIRTSRKRSVSKRKATGAQHVAQTGTGSERRDSLIPISDDQANGKRVLKPKSLKQAVEDGVFETTDSDDEYEEPDVPIIKGGTRSRGRKRTVDSNTSLTTQRLEQLKHEETLNAVMIDGGPKYRGYKRVADIDTVFGRQANRKPRSLNQQYNDCTNALDFLTNLPDLPDGLNRMIIDTSTLLGQEWKYFFLFTEYLDSDPSNEARWMWVRRNHIAVVHFFVDKCKNYQKAIGRADHLGYGIDFTQIEGELLPLLECIKELGEEADEKGEREVQIKDWERPGTKEILENDEIEVAEVESDDSDDDEDDTSGSEAEEDIAEQKTGGEVDTTTRAKEVEATYDEMDWDQA